MSVPNIQSGSGKREMVHVESVLRFTDDTQVATASPASRPDERLLPTIGAGGGVGKTWSMDGKRGLARKGARFLGAGFEG